MPRQRAQDPLVKPMHLRLSRSQDDYISKLADTTDRRRQDVVRAIIAEHMERHHA